MALLVDQTLGYAAAKDEAEVKLMKNEREPITLSEIKFELKDIEVFKIPDTRTRLDTIQNYFFPRLEILLRETLELIQEIYRVNPYEQMTFVYTPSHRKNAQINKDPGYVHIGITGKKRSKDKPLTIRRKSGYPAFCHSTYLTYDIYPDGTINACFNPFRNYVDLDYLSKIRSYLQLNLDLLNKILVTSHISYTRGAVYNNPSFLDIFSDANHAKKNLFKVFFFSPTYYFPVTRNRGLWELKLSFVSLYPLLELFISIAEEKEVKFSERLEKLYNWHLEQGWYFARSGEVKDDIELENIEVSSIPEIDSYSFVRAGLWWEVLARDKWTCCSCGRSVKEHGITLHVDHIVPRSKGGTNDKSNLQTLCIKCNIGKSNKDSTDLRGQF